MALLPIPENLMDCNFPTTVKVPIKLLGSKSLTNYQKMVWIQLQLCCTMGCSIFSFSELAKLCGLSPSSAEIAGKVLLKEGLVYKATSAGSELRVLGGAQ